MAYSKNLRLYLAGSTGGVATTLAHWSLKRGLAEAFIVSRRYQSYLARSLEELESSAGSVYEDFQYGLEVKRSFHLGQIGKPCDMSQDCSPRISLFCSRIYSNQKNPIDKKSLKEKSRASRFLEGLKNQPRRCWKCGDHVGEEADISCGDSQQHPKVNHVIVRTSLGQEIWDGCLHDKLIFAQEIPFETIYQEQIYLFKGVRGWCLRKIFPGM